MVSMSRAQVMSHKSAGTFMEGEGSFRVIYIVVEILRLPNEGGK